MQINATNLIRFSSFRQAFLIAVSITVIIALSYSLFSRSRLKLSIPTSTSSCSNSVECKLSLRESDNWFCESDIDWKRRKELHHLQDRRNRHSNGRSLFFQNNWEPTIQCEFEQRIGNSGDGGKWVCDIHRFDQLNYTNLLIYSFGSNGEFSFEQAMKQRLPQAEIHTFDMGLYQCPNTTCTFHQARLGNGKNGTSKSLHMITNELKHQNREIHILKMDIEGGEFEFFEELFHPSSKAQYGVPLIRQILFEIHLGPDGSEEPSQRTHRLFELFRSNYFAIYHKEVNLYDARNVFEYGLIRLNATFFNS